MAAGLSLDNPDVHIYRQSYISAHSELTWILDCFTYFGEMRRMTQFKDKSATLMMDAGTGSFSVPASTEGRADWEAHEREVVAKMEKSVSVGLFNYPVLMAADILLYGAEYVPVGDDQTQHLEFTRDIAERMNKKFGDLLIVPQPVKKQHEFFGKDQGLRIRDLQNPSKKMSKSDESGKGVIFLTDTPETARKKIMGAETDSAGEIRYDYENQPGISNLLDILKLLGGSSDEYIGQNQYGPLKTAVADKIAEFLSDFQAKLAAVNNDKIAEKLAASETEMRKVAEARLLEVQKALGLRPQ